MSWQHLHQSVSPDTGRQSARHGASRHAPPTAGAVPSSPARPARPQRKNYIVLSTRGSVEDAWRVFTSAELSDLSCGPGRGPEHNNLGWHSLYLGGKRCNPRVPGLSCLAARENVPGKPPSSPAWPIGRRSRPGRRGKLPGHWPRHKHIYKHNRRR